MTLRLMAALLVALAATAACKKNTPVTAPPAPLRPAPVPKAAAPTATKTDCNEPRIGSALPAMTYGQRQPRIQEAEALAKEGVNKLTAAEGSGLDPKSREEMVTDAVESLIASLAADPYNVHATYNLAAAYARIGRRQCALNMLDRLIAMRDHHSRKAEVNKHLDRLLGRNGKPLDPDFRDLRQDETFACLIGNIGGVPKPCFEGTGS